MNCQFQVGDKVVCVDDGDPPVPLKEGAVYTISGFCVESPRMPKDGIAICVTIMEMPNIWPKHNIDVGFNPRRFRPVKTTKTDISIFTEIVRREFDTDRVSKPVRETVGE